MIEDGRFGSRTYPPEALHPILSIVLPKSNVIPVPAPLIVTDELVAETTFEEITVPERIFHSQRNRLRNGRSRKKQPRESDGDVVGHGFAHRGVHNGRGERRRSRFRHVRRADDRCDGSIGNDNLSRRSGFYQTVRRGFVGKGSVTSGCGVRNDVSGNRSVRELCRKYYGPKLEECE